MTIDRRIWLGGAAAMLLPAAGCRGEPKATGAVPKFEAPVLAGSHGIGRTGLVTPGAGPVILFYPVDGQPSPTLHPAAVMAPGHEAQLTRRFGAGVAHALADAQGYAVPKASVARGDWPLLVFAPGWYLSGQDYRVLAEQVASHGYIVAVLSDLPGSGSHPPYAATAEAIGAVLTEVGKTVSFPAAGAFGHSVGGAAAVLAASRFPWLKAVVNLDGDYADDALAARPKQPLLHVQSVTPDEPANGVARRHRDWQTVSQASSSPHLLPLERFRHLNFLDAALLSAHVPQDRRRKAFGEVDPVQGLATAVGLVTGFFDEHLKGRAGAFAE